MNEQERRRALAVLLGIMNDEATPNWDRVTVARDLIHPFELNRDERPIPDQAQAAAHALLVEMLDDDDSETRQRAAGVLLDAHRYVMSEHERKRKALADVMVEVRDELRALRADLKATSP
jgi:DNA-directed RNA polymerase subunit F